MRAVRRESVQELKQLLRAPDPQADQSAVLTRVDHLYAAGRPQAIRGRGTGIGLGASPTGRNGDFSLAVRVQDRDLLHSPELARIVTAAKGEVDVSYVGPGFKQVSPRAPRSKGDVTIGCSIGHPAITAGTLGCFVGTSQGVSILSNNHVLADEDRAKIGDPILQPGPWDGGTVGGDEVGQLQEVVPLVLERINYMDAALASIDPNIDYAADQVPGLGTLVGVVDLTGTEGLVKVGRTTGLTRGRVVGLDVDGLTLTYEKGPVTFDGVVEIAGLATPFTAGGDSGALIVTDSGQPEAAALHFGGLSNGHSVAAPLSRVLNEFGASLVN